MKPEGMLRPRLPDRSHLSDEQASPDNGAKLGKVAEWKPLRLIRLLKGLIMQDGPGITHTHTHARTHTHSDLEWCRFKGVRWMSPPDIWGQRPLEVDYFFLWCRCYILLRYRWR